MTTPIVLQSILHWAHIQSYITPSRLWRTSWSFNQELVKPTTLLCSTSQELNMGRVVADHGGDAFCKKCRAGVGLWVQKATLELSPPCIQTQQCYHGSNLALQITYIQPKPKAWVRFLGRNARPFYVLWSNILVIFFILIILGQPQEYTQKISRRSYLI